MSTIIIVADAEGIRLGQRKGVVILILQGTTSNYGLHFVADFVDFLALGLDVSSEGSGGEALVISLGSRVELYLIKLCVNGVLCCLHKKCVHVR